MNILSSLINKKFLSDRFCTIETLKVFSALTGFFWIVTSFYNLETVLFCVFAKPVTIKGVCICVSVLLTLIARRPLISCASKISGTDTKIRITVGDIFKCQGDVVIPVDTAFNVEVNEKIISERSLHGQFINNFFENNVEELDNIISQQLAHKTIVGQRESQNNGKLPIYDIGTSVIWHNSQKKQKFILCAMATMNASDIAKAHPSDVYKACQKVYSLYNFEITKTAQLNVPLMGTGFGRGFEARISCILTIICSFLENSSFSNGCNELNIVIFEKDYYSSGLNIYSLRHLLEALCSNPKIAFTLCNLHCK